MSLGRARELFRAERFENFAAIVFGFYLVVTAHRLSPTAPEYLEILEREEARQNRSEASEFTLSLTQPRRNGLASESDQKLPVLLGNGPRMRCQN